jgi:hypothetical protein
MKTSGATVAGSSAPRTRSTSLSERRQSVRAIAVMSAAVAP